MCEFDKRMMMIMIVMLMMVVMMMIKKTQNLLCFMTEEKSLTYNQFVDK